METNENLENDITKEEVLQSLNNFDITALDISALKRLECEILICITNGLHQYFFEEIAVCQMLRDDVDAKRVHTLNDYTSNMSKLQKGLDSLHQYSKTINISGYKMNTSLDTLFTADKVGDYKNLKETIDLLKPYFKISEKIALFLDQNTDLTEYLRIIPTLHGKMITTLNNASEFMQKSNNQFIPDTKFVGTLAELLTQYNQKIIERQKINEHNIASSIVNLKPTSQTQKSQTEIERLNYINKANVLYDQLQKDWIVDLKAQYSFSVKDKYQAFFEKLKKFQNTFKMPLNTSTSTGFAKEACTQINNLMNNISSISNDAYTIGM